MKTDKRYPRIGVGAFIVSDESKFFLAKRGPAARMEQGLWEFPGGGVEFGESPEAAIIREIQEEHGVKIKVNELVYICNEYVEEKSRHWISPVFLCEIIQGEPSILEPEACTDIGWFSIEEIKNMDLTSYSKKDLIALEKLLSRD